MSHWIRVLAVISFGLFLSGCVTTTESPYEDKKDLKKAEQSYIQIGYEYFQNGNLLESKTALTKALDINSRSSGAHLGLARVYDRELETQLAHSHFKKAMRYADETEPRFQYAVFLYNQGNYKGAYRQFDKVLADTLYARRAQAFEFQGLVATRLGRTENAISFYRRAIALNSGMANSYIGLTNIYLNQLDSLSAYQFYNGFIQLVRSQQARHTAATLWLGIQLADAQQDADAISSFELQLRNRFKLSAEYQQYLKWKEAKGAS